MSMAAPSARAVNSETPLFERPGIRQNVADWKCKVLSIAKREASPIKKRKKYMSNNDSERIFQIRFPSTSLPSLYYIIGWTSVVVAGALHIYSNVRQRCFLIDISGYAERVCFVGGHTETSELRRTKYNRETFGRLPGRWESTTAAIQQHSASNNNGGFILSLNLNSFLSFFFYWNKMSQWHWGDLGERHVIQSKFHQTVIPFDPLATCCYCMNREKGKERVTLGD